MKSKNEVQVKAKFIPWSRDRSSGTSGSMQNKLDADAKRGRKRLSKLLKERREAVGISQRVLGVMLGVTQSQVTRAERSGEVDFVLMERWAAALGCPLTVFYTQDPSTLSYPVWDPHAYHYRNHSAEDWKVFHATKGGPDGANRWPKPEGWEKFARTHYKMGKAEGGKGTLFEPGEGLEFFRMQEAIRTGICDADGQPWAVIPSPS